MPKKTRVTRQSAPQPVRQPPPRPRAAAPVYSLPTEKTWPSDDIREYSLLLYGPPGIGKTTFFTSFPDVIYFLTEPGKPSGVYIFNKENGGVTDWKVMLAGVDLLEKERKRFQNVVIDTLDEGYEMCQRQVCKEAGVDHPHDANDYGKTWDKVTRGFKDVFSRIKRTGRGLYLTSHAKEGVVHSASGTEFTRIGPSLTGKAGAKVLALVDFIFYVDYYTVGGVTRRVVTTDGTELVVGKQRPIGPDRRHLPLYIMLPKDDHEDYEVFAAAFRGEVEGIDPKIIMPSKQTGKAGTEAVKQARARELTKGGRGKR